MAGNRDTVWGSSVLALIKISDDEILSLSYSLHVSVSPSEFADQFTKSKATQNGIPYVFMPEKPPQFPHKALRIMGYTMRITGMVDCAGSSAKLSEWDIGFAQSIYECERVGKYVTSMGKTQTRTLRLDTEANGCLKDGSDDSIFYTDTKFRTSNTNKVVLEDAPNFLVPVQAGFGGNCVLKSTEGGDYYKSFLVLARERDKSIVSLGYVEWAIDWAGEFDNKNLTWTDKSEKFLTHNTVFDPRLYLGLQKSREITPFSLLTGEAEQWCQIKDLARNTYQRCDISGNTHHSRIPKPPTSGKWLSPSVWDDILSSLNK